MIIFFRHSINKTTPKIIRLDLGVKFFKKISSSTKAFTKLEFAVNKFNDIHIKKENVTKFVKEINSNHEHFENVFKSNFAVQK
jgi:hypothetical protein